MPDGPDDVHILVELRFDPGRYDLSDGPFQNDELISCSHLLLNGQNSTIISHFREGATAGAVSPTYHGRTARWLFASKGSHHVAVLNFVFDTFAPTTTMEQIKNVSRNSSGAIKYLDIRIKEHHATWNDNFTTLQPVTEDGAFNVFGDASTGENSHYGGWAAGLVW
jgi:hypothetical protein